MPQWTTWIIAIGLGIGLGLLMNRSNKTNKGAIHFLSKDDFYNNMRKGQLVDIRKEREFEENKIKGARNFKVSQLTGKYSKIRKDQSVYLYCNNGKKSKRAATKLSREGYTSIYVLDKGLEQ